MGDQEPSANGEQKSMNSVQIEGRVGVVAIGRNEGKRLIQCLDSLASLDLPVVYVDSASIDGSPSVARSRGADVLDLDLTTPFTAARARNEGFERLKLIAPNIDYVQFVDGDCEIEDEWISAAVQFLDQRAEVAVVCGRRRERFPDASFYNMICDQEWNTKIGQSEACGGDALIRVNCFATVDGYNGSLIAGEEPELCSRMRTKGMQIWRIDQPMTVHDAAMYSFRQWWLRAVRSGFGYAQVWWTTRETDNVLYHRELARTLFWALLVPLIVFMAGVLNPLYLLLLPVIYSLQIARIAIRQTGKCSFSWKSATLNMIGKFGETLGIFRWLFRSLKGRQGGAIFYK